MGYVRSIYIYIKVPYSRMAVGLNNCQHHAELYDTVAASGIWGRNVGNRIETPALNTPNPEPLLD